MGRMPQYSIGQVKPRVLPNVNLRTDSTQVSSADFGAKKTAQVGQFGQSIQDLGEYIQHETNKARVRDAVNTARTSSREYMNEVLNRKGKDALGVYEEAQKKYDEFAKDAQKDLNLPIQQEAFKEMFGQMRNRDLTRTLSHQDQEAYRYKIATLDAENQNELDDVMFMAQDKNTSWQDYSEGYETILANTREKYAPMGDEVVKTALQDAKNTFHSKVSSTLAKSQSAKKAKDYLNDMRGEISAQVYKGLMDSYKAQDITETAHAKALEIFDSGKDVEKQLDAARRLPADISGAVEAKVSRWNKQREYAAEKAEKELVSGQVDAINKQLDARRNDLSLDGKSVDQIIMSVEKAQGVELPPSIRMRVRDSWYKLIEARDNPRKKQALEQDMANTYRGLLDKAIENPVAFANENLVQYYGALRKEDFNSLLRRQEKIKAVDIKAQRSEQEKIEDQVDDEVDKALKFLNKQNPFPKEEGKKEQLEWNNARTELEQFIRKEIEALPKEKRTPEALQSIQNRAFLGTRIKVDWGFDSKEVPMYMLNYVKSRTEDAGGVYFTDEGREQLAQDVGIPTSAKYSDKANTFVLADIDEVEQWLKKQGQPLIDPKTKKKISELTFRLDGTVATYRTRE